MVMDARRRQRKLERRKAKEKAKKKTQAKRNLSEPALRIERAATAPILHCRTTSMLWDQGMSNLVISRELPSGNVAFVAFLLDVYCLGVKDVFFTTASRSRYDSLLRSKLFRDCEVINLSPAAARKLVEGAVDYAGDLGLSPHPDYRTGKLIFGDIDTASCTDEFIYGKDGKPFFIAGPHDGSLRCEQIVSKLTARCGADGFHFLFPVGPSTSEQILRIDDADDVWQ